LRTCLEDGTVRWRLYNLWVTRPTYLGSVYCSVSFALESIKELLLSIQQRRDKQTIFPELKKLSNRGRCVTCGEEDDSLKRGTKRSVDGKPKENKDSRRH